MQMATRGQVLPNDQDNYGIYRADANKTTGPGWRVFLQRQGRRISRAFQDSVYGSSDAGLAQAKSYRDAVISAIPPRTNHEQAVLLKKSNRSGISGVRYAEYNKGPFWMAMIDTPEGRKNRSFSVSKYGYEEAKARAIAQRQAWLKEHPVSYLGSMPDADAPNDITYRPEPAPDVYPCEHLPEAEVKARLASIDARFDALRPPRLIVRVRCYQGSDLAVYVSNAGRPARNKQMYIGMRRQSLDMALTKARPKIESAITEFYNANVTQWFMNERGRGLLDPARFDPNEGFSELVFVPTELISKYSGQ